MAASNIVRRLRGLVGNALLWGALWFSGALVVMAIIRLLGGAENPAPWLDVVRGAMMFAVMGTLAGTAFSTFIGMRYHGQSLSRIGWVRFAILGGIVVGLFVPGFISVMRAISGDAPLAFASLFRNGVVGLVFGGVAAGASMKVAQLGKPALPESDDAELLDSGEG